jgi:hypothetical protein
MFAAGPHSPALVGSAAYGVPVPMLRSWVDGHRDEDIATSLAALGSAIGQDRAVG